ncbi:glycosyltransferase family 4 protein [Paenibacillus sp. CMAA1364]
MRIGVDAHILAGKFQGSRTYLLNLYHEVMKQECDHDYCFFGFWSAGYPYGNDPQYIDFKSTSKIKRLTYQTSPLVKEHQIDLYHTTYISPIMLPCDVIVTIHDVLFETHPQYFTNREVLRNKILVRYSAKRAKQIHTVSEYSKSKIIELYGIPEHKVKVVPNGVDISRFSSDNKALSIDLVYEKYGVKDYILTVGRIEPRKNHLQLLDAYMILKQKLSDDAGCLVIVGQPDFGFTQFFERMKELGLEKDVLIIDSVDDVVLPHLYRAARIFVYPSFAEGFGIPPIEAMASGIPVVSSNTTAIPEVIGEAGILVDPNNAEEIAAQMEVLLTNMELQESLRLKGLEQVKKWTWKSSADAYVQALAEVYQ